jgi:hypothetical protein
VPEGEDVAGDEGLEVGVGEVAGAAAPLIWDGSEAGETGSVELLVSGAKEGSVEG